MVRIDFSVRHALMLLALVVLLAIALMLTAALNPLVARTDRHAGL